MSKNKPTLLLVDDAPNNIILLNDILRDEFKIKAAPNGEKALRLAQQEPIPDLVLLDIIMPDMNGYEVCRRLKADPATAAIPVIFVTAMSEETDETKGLKLGAVDFITKPISPPVVLARVHTHLKQREMRIELEQKNIALEQAAQLRDDVDRMMKHDLKNPLNIIVQGPPIIVETLQSTNDGDVDQNLKILQMIASAGHTMLEMINSSLDLYKMETGVYNLKAKPVDILSVLHSTLHEMEVSQKSYGREVVIRIQGREIKKEDQLWAEAEKMICYPMFSNLLGNAFEASPKGTTVEVDLERDGGDVIIMITNSGVVPEAIRANFFEKYITANKEKGTGLGTYSARLCAETQNGSIGMEILEEQQTRITVRLPFADKG